MKKIYLYPQIDYRKTDSSNTYVKDLNDVLCENFIVVNRKYNKVGIIDLFRYFFVTDIYFFNWIEELPSNKFGKIQSIVFLIFLIILKISRKKIFWVLHNRESHNKSGSRKWKQFIFRLMIKYSDVIITHSSSGVEFIKENYQNQVSKVHFIIHPIKDIVQKKSWEKDFDLMIWGTIYPYKGILEFLRFISQKDNNKKYKILIIGYCPNKDYEKTLSKIMTDNILFVNRFIEMVEIIKYAHKSRFILFTYNSKSVLSSGSLMDSIRFGVPIIGPNIGIFKDLNNYDFIKTYKNYEDILNILDSKQDLRVNEREIEHFCRENSWHVFGKKIHEIAMKNSFVNKSIS